jgi:hypothetical protein
MEVSSDVIVLFLDGRHKTIMFFAHREHIALKSRPQRIRD